MSVLQNFQNKKGIILLLDPDKIQLSSLTGLCSKIESSPVDMVFVGGSTVEQGVTEEIVSLLKTNLNKPIVLFPGEYHQISGAADAILYLSLLSGRNPEYLIEQHIKSVPLLEHLDLEIIPTSYILIDGGHTPSTARVTQTSGMSQEYPKQIRDTAIAGMWQGKKMTYLEAGSGAIYPVKSEVISMVKKAVNHPVIVGGGIKSSKDIDAAFDAGADFIVIGTAFENNPNLFDTLNYVRYN